MTLVMTLVMIAFMISVERHLCLAHLSLIIEGCLCLRSILSAPHNHRPSRINDPPNHVIGYQAPAILKPERKRDLGIGSTYTEVRAAYAGVIDGDDSSSSHLVAGSRFGGVMFNLSEERGNHIFVGASAE